MNPFSSNIPHLSLSITVPKVQEYSERENEGITDSSEHIGDVYDGGGLSGSDMQSTATELLCECNHIFSSAI